MNSLEYGPVCGALTVEASLLLPGQDVPDDDRLWVLLGVHQWTEGHHVPEDTTTAHKASESSDSHISPNNIHHWVHPHCAFTYKLSSISLS